jgi:hypothetical protein
MDRNNHYERAFEAYLQDQRLCYVAVDETRRALLGEGPVKSLDFIVCGLNEARLVVDVKGRRFPGGPPGKRRYFWECWAEREDIDGLQRWAAVLGPGYRGVLVFAYHLLAEVELPPDTPDLWTWQGRRYLLRAVPVEDYRDHMRTRSPRWDTVDLSRTAFRSLVRPVCDLTGAVPEYDECPF